MPLVDIPEVGEVEFPDSMAPADIEREAGRAYADAVARKSPLLQPIVITGSATPWDPRPQQEMDRAFRRSDLRAEGENLSVEGTNPGNTLTKAQTGFARGAAQLSESLNRGIGSLLQRIADSPALAIFRGPATGQALETTRATGEHLEDTANFVRPTVKELQLVEKATPGSQFVADVAGGVPSLAPSIASAPVAGLPIFLAGLQTYGSTLGDAEEGFRRQGLPEDQVRERSREVAAVTGLATSLLTGGFNRFGPGLEKWTESLAAAPGKSALREMSKQFGFEFTEEGLDQFVQGVAAQRSYDPAKPWSAIVKESLAAALVGGTVAFGLRGATHADEQFQMLQELKAADPQFDAMSRTLADDTANLASLPQNAQRRRVTRETRFANVEPQLMDPSLEPARGSEIPVGRDSVEPTIESLPAKAPVVESAKPPSVAETITGSPAKANEETASAMPAEREERPTPKAGTSKLFTVTYRFDDGTPKGQRREARVRASSKEEAAQRVAKRGTVLSVREPRPIQADDPTRPWDLIDEIEATIGRKISLKLIREANPHFKPTGALRKLFNADSGEPADTALDTLQRERKVDANLDVGQFADLLQATANARQTRIARSANEKKLVEVEGKQRSQFEQRVLQGQRPKAEQDNIERVPVEAMVEGDKFTAQGHEFTVKDLGFDDNGDVVSMTVKDGPKFGVQVIDPGKVEFIHIDKGTMQPVPREAWAVPEAEPVAPAPAAPTIKSGQKQGDLLGSGGVEFNLYGERGADGDRVTAEQAAKEQAARESAAFAAKNQRTMSGFGDPLASPIPTPAAATPPPGTPGTALLFDARLPVTLARTREGQVTIPQVMQSLEGVITAAGGQTPIRVGRFNKARARGVYMPKTEVTRINSADNIPTAAHEIGHASQKLLYGSAYAAGLKGLPSYIKAELVALGRALYGSTRPAAGYSGEGWAEFIRIYLTTDEAPTKAKATEKFFREHVLKEHPEFARAIDQARQLIDVYRAQGSVGRAKAQIVKRPGALQRIIKTIADTVSMRNQVDEFDPLWKLSQGYKERSGNELSPAADPFLLASWKRGTAGAVVETMVNDAMIDPWGNPLLGPGNMSLKQALAPIKGRGEDFALYLFGRRALERWSQNKNPGITKDDAQYLVDQFESPEFSLAAENYYEWHRGLLQYVAAADPAMAGTVEAILGKSGNYAPLARVIDPKGATALAATARSNPLQRMHGSGRQVRDIFETTLENASRLVAHAHRKMVLNSIVDLSQHEGMGFLVEEVPRSKVKTEVNFEKLRQQLEDMGVDTSMVNPDEILAFFDLADTPKGADPIIVSKQADGLHWYHVNPEVYEILNGLDPYRLPAALDLLFGAPTRAFRLGTTGLRASFSLFTNPARDLRTFVLQTQSDANPARLAYAYFSSLAEVVRAGLGGKSSPHVEAFNRLGAKLGQPLGADIQHTKRAAKGLFHGKMMRVVTNPIDHLRDLLQITESAPRVAELKLIAEEAGWKPGQMMTPDQAVQIALAAKRVTVDFSAGGRIAKVLNQAIPFYNASVQGTRSFARTIRDNPTRAVLYGLTTFTLPALLNWWRNKDEEWYRQLPWRERYLYDNVRDDQGNVWQIPRPPEWGNFFSVLPEAILDSWYRKDPRGVKEALKHMLDTSNPLDYPVLAKIAKEQWQNRIDFFARPIVPRSQIDLPPGEQRSPYTTKLGQWLGHAFPNTISPRRFDAAVRGYFGGALPDLQQSLEAAGVKAGILGASTAVEREEELSDLPVLGRMFRRGGEFSAANLSIGDYYDELTRLSAKVAAQELAWREGRELNPPMDSREYAFGKLLEDMSPTFKAASQVADRTASAAARQSLYRDMAREADRLMEQKPKLD